MRYVRLILNMGKEKEKGGNHVSKKQERKISDDYMATLEEVKKQYQQYVEVSRLYELPTHKEEEPVQYQPPSLEHPLTTNRIHINRTFSPPIISLPAIEARYG